jgi:hypothetical protein
VRRDPQEMNSGGKIQNRLKLKQWLEVYCGYHVNQGKHCHSLYCSKHGKPAGS